MRRGTVPGGGERRGDRDLIHRGSALVRRAARYEAGEIGGAPPPVAESAVAGWLDLADGPGAGDPSAGGAEPGARGAGARVGGPPAPAPGGVDEGVCGDARSRSPRRWRTPRGPRPPPAEILLFEGGSPSEAAVLASGSRSQLLIRGRWPRRKTLATRPVVEADGGAAGRVALPAV